MYIANGNPAPADRFREWGQLQDRSESGGSRVPVLDIARYMKPVGFTGVTVREVSLPVSTKNGNGDLYRKEAEDMQRLKMLDALRDIKAETWSTGADINSEESPAIGAFVEWEVTAHFSRGAVDVVLPM